MNGKTERKEKKNTHTHIEELHAIIHNSQQRLCSDCSLLFLKVRSNGKKKTCTRREIKERYRNRERERPTCVMKYKMKATLPLITAPVVTVHKYRGDFTIWAMALRARSFSGSLPLI